MTTYTKLRDGSWGVRGTGSAPEAGSVVTVTKKSGETKSERIAKVLWSADGKWMASVEQSGRAPAGRAYRNGARGGRVDCRRYGWDGVYGSSSYYTSGQYDEDS